MSIVPTTAMILAAGFGKRLQPLTDHTPKVLAPINGRPLLAFLLDKLRAVGVKNIVINLHHHPEQVKDFCQTQNDFNWSFSYEDPILETGGGVVKALPYIDEDIFYIFNGDACWVDSDGTNLLEDLCNTWHDGMDFLCGVYPTQKLPLSDKRSDYFLEDDGKLRYKKPDEAAPYLFASMRLARRDVFEGWDVKPFSQKKLFDIAESKGRFYGLPLKGQWLNVDTLDNLKAAEKILQDV